MRKIKDRLLRNKYISLVITLSVGVFSAIGIFSISSVNNLLTLSELEKKSESNILALESTLSSLKDIETGVRGFVITEDISYLEPYTEGYLQIESQIKELRESFIGNPKQINKLKTLIPLVEKRIEIALEVISITKAKGTLAGKQSILSRKGKDAMDRVRYLANEIKTQENLKISTILEQRESAGQSLVAITISLLLFEFIILTTALILLNKEMRVKSDALTQIEVKYEELNRFYNKQSPVYSEASQVLNDVINILRKGKPQ